MTGSTGRAGWSEGDQTIRGSDDLMMGTRHPKWSQRVGVPARRLAVALFVPSPRADYRAVGFPLRSLTRNARSWTGSVLVAGLLLAGCDQTHDPTTGSDVAEIEKNCADLPRTFSSYEEAINQVRSRTFVIAEEQNTDESSWMRGAEFYSCDGVSGFFILHTDARAYIHADLPLEVWEGFKSATSFGTYYNANIKRRYRLALN